MKNDWIRVRIHWIDWKTKQEGVWEEPVGEPASAWKGEDGEVDLFQWAENNYSCDHNRCLFFLGYSGDDDTEEEFNCGSKRLGILELWAEVAGEWVKQEYAEPMPKKWEGINA